MGVRCHFSEMVSKCSVCFQFLNMWTKQDNFELENPSLTSTPVCNQKSGVTTPLHRDKTPLTQKENSVCASKLYPTSVYVIRHY